MKSYEKTIHRFIKYFLIAILVSACSGQSSVLTASSATDNIPLTTTPTAENLELKTAIFDGTIIPGTLEGLPVALGVGSLTNDQGTLQIIASGTSDDIVVEYFNTARFYFEIKETSNPPSPNVNPIESVELPLSDILMADKGNLLIQFDLPPDTKEKYPKGSLFVAVDPVLGEKQQHIYLPTDPSTNQADVEITSQQGSVLGQLFLQGIGKMDEKKTTNPNIPEMISGAGNGVFDLVVTGLESGNNEYQLRGTWSYGLTDSAPVEPISPPSPTSITFDFLPDGTPITEDRILVGDEYLSQGIYLSGAPESSYCEEGKSAAIRSPNTYNDGPPYYFLTTSLPNDVSLCNSIPVAISFTNPIRMVTLTFYGASETYSLSAYDKEGAFLGTVYQDGVWSEGRKISFLSEDSKISLVTFGRQPAVTAITEIYFEP